MHIRFDLVSGPALEPATLAELKSHAKIEIDDDDALLTIYIATARQRIEEATGRALIEQQWTATLACWPEPYEGERHRRIRLAHFPISAIDAVSVDGVAVDSGAYRLDGKDILVSTEVAGSAGSIADAGIVIAFTAGYGAAASDVPAQLRLALMMLAAHYYEARGATSPQGIYHQLIPEGVQALLAPYIVLEI